MEPPEPAADAMTAKKFSAPRCRSGCRSIGTVWLDPAVWAYARHQVDSPRRSCPAGGPDNVGHTLPRELDAVEVAVPVSRQNRNDARQCCLIRPADQASHFGIESLLQSFSTMIFQPLPGGIGQNLLRFRQPRPICSPKGVASSSFRSPLISPLHTLVGMIVLGRGGEGERMISTEKKKKKRASPLPRIISVRDYPLAGRAVNPMSICRPS